MLHRSSGGHFNMGKAVEAGMGLKTYYKGKIEELEMLIKDKSHNLKRLEAQRNELNTHGRLMWVVPTAAGRHMLTAVLQTQCGYCEKSFSCYRSLARMWGRSSRSV